jgi:plastocyanin
MKWMRVSIAGLALASVVGACGGDDGTEPNDDPIVGTPVNAGSNNVFNPASVSIAVGGSVTWVFGPVDHNVIFSGTGSPNNIGDTHNRNVTRTFNTAGTFNYICSLHAGMSGNVIVQ